MQPQDRVWRRTFRKASGAMPIPWSITGLEPLRREVLEEVLQTHRPAGEALEARLAAGDPAARTALAAVAEQALLEFRTRVERSAQGLARVWCRTDQRWRTDGLEYMDDPNLDEGRRTAIIEALDDWNALVGSYDLFLDHLRPLLRNTEPTRVMDLATGHAGFALALARSARAEGISLAITATDLRREYLDVGARAAAAEGLEVDFQVQDALDLSGFGEDTPDIVTCTQAIHHFPAGLVAVMFQEAARAATRGVVFIDGCRSMMNAVPMATMGYLYLRSPDFVHDGVLSLRRFFVPEELELLARLGPWGDGVESEWIPPGHCLLRLARG